MAREATLCNVNRAEYGTVGVDLDLLQNQIYWLLGMPVCAERDGIVNLLEGITDLADPPEDEEED